MTVDKDRVQIRMEVARGHWALAERDQALNCLERAVREEPTYPGLRDLIEEMLSEANATTSLGVSNERLLRMLDEIDHRWMGAVAEDPVPAIATATLAQLLADQGHTERALRVAQDVLRANPGDERARAVRARLRPMRNQRIIRELERWLENSRNRRRGVRA